MDEFGLREIGKKEGLGGMPEVFYIYRNSIENSTTDWIGIGQNGLGQAGVFSDTGVKQEIEVFETGMIENVLFLQKSGYLRAPLLQNLAG